MLDAVDYDPSGNIVFSGQGEPGNNARIYVDNAPVGDAPIAADGRWSFSGTARVTPGVHSLRIDSLDAGGSVTSRIEVPFFREDTKNVASAEPAAEEGDTQKTDAQVPAATAEPASAVPDEGRVVIQPGNNLWRISKVIYGDATKYTLLYQANQDQIRDPDLIYPGQVFKTPDVAPPGKPSIPKRRDPLTAETRGAVFRFAQSGVQMRHEPQDTRRYEHALAVGWRPVGHPAGHAALSVAGGPSGPEGPGGLRHGCAGAVEARHGRDALCLQICHRCADRPGRCGRHGRQRGRCSSGPGLWRGPHHDGGARPDPRRRLRQGQPARGAGACGPHLPPPPRACR